MAETTETETLGLSKNSLFFHLKSRLSMIYNVTKPTAPKMPRLKKGTKCIKNLLMQVSKDMYEPHISIFFPIFFPIFGAA